MTLIVIVLNSSVGPVISPVHSDARRARQRSSPDSSHLLQSPFASRVLFRRKTTGQTSRGYLECRRIWTDLAKHIFSYMRHLTVFNVNPDFFKFEIMRIVIYCCFDTQRLPLRSLCCFQLSVSKGTHACADPSHSAKVGTVYSVVNS